MKFKKQKNLTLKVETSTFLIISIQPSTLSLGKPMIYYYQDLDFDGLIRISFSRGLDLNPFNIDKNQALCLI